MDCLSGIGMSKGWKPILQVVLGASVFSLSALFPLRGEAIVIRHDRSDSLYQELATQSQFAPVGRIGAVSGTLIAPDWVLTAAHINGSTFTLGGGSYDVSENIPHPNWNGDVTSGFDVRLLRLSTPVPNVTPALIYGGNQELGQVGTFVASGATGDGIAGATLPSGTKRAAQNQLDAFGVNTGSPGSLTINFNDGPLLLADFDHPVDASLSFLGSSAPLNLEGTLASQDSGGGTFVLVGNTWLLAGVHSFIFDVDSNGSSTQYGGGFGITRVSPHADWIQSQTGVVAVQPIPWRVNGGVVIPVVLIFSVSRWLRRCRRRPLRLSPKSCVSHG